MIVFSEKACEEIEFVVSELASNLVKHGGGGELIIQPLQDGARRGIRIETLDRGKGIRDPEEAIADGYTTSGSLGYGLGTVNRLMDELNIEPVLERNGGTRVACQRWLRQASQDKLPSPLDMGGASRSKPGMKLNGDAFYLKSWEQSALVAAIDGVGHGQFANRRDRLRGFALGAFRIPDVVRKVDPDSRESGINVFVFDTTKDKANSSLLFGHCPDNPKLAEQPDVACVLKAAGTDLNYQADLSVGGRIWRLLLVATPGYLQGRVTLLPHTVIAMGLFATLLSGLFVLKNAKASKELFDKSQALNTEIDERRNAEARLRQSEEMYRLLFDQSESLISVYDVHGYCLMMNQKLAKLFGGLPEQFIGKKFAIKRQCRNHEAFGYQHKAKPEIKD